MSRIQSKPAMRVMDMTQGSPAKLILAFAVPLFIGNIFQQVYSMVDTAVAGYCLGDGAIAAIGATSSLYALLIDFAAGLNSGCAIVVTQRFGAQDTAKLKTSIAGMILLDAVVTFVLTLLSLGVKNMYLGPTMPAFLSETVTKVLVDTYGLQPITAPEQDMDAILGRG